MPVKSLLTCCCLQKIKSWKTKKILYRLVNILITFLFFPCESMLHWVDDCRMCSVTCVHMDLYHEIWWVWSLDFFYQSRLLEKWGHSQFASLHMVTWPFELLVVVLWTFVWLKFAFIDLSRLSDWGLMS